MHFQKISHSFFILFVVSIFPLLMQAQDRVVQSFFTTASFREKFYDGLIKWSIKKNLAATLDDSNSIYDFKSAFWPMELIRYKTDYAEQRLTYAFTRAASSGKGFQRGLIEVAYANWPEKFRSQVNTLMQQTTDPKIFAMCAEYLWRGGRHAEEKKQIELLLQKKINTMQDNPILLMLRKRLQGAINKPLPPLTKLFSEQFAPGLTVMYSFQRPDRNYPGLVIVRKPDGHFVRDTTGTIFSVAQLARSISDLPAYLTNGNTPQGIYRMSGFDVSSSRFIGPTENIQLSLPYEIPADSFIISFSSRLDTSWEIGKYRTLLPGSWQQYDPVYEAYYAGEAGRTAIIAHGTTIDPGYYIGQIYFPQTPSLGCLCTYESWSSLSGVREESDQQKLVNAIKKAGNGIGYAIVIELDDQKSPVTLKEILPYILKAEKSEGTEE